MILLSSLIAFSQCTIQKLESSEEASFSNNLMEREDLPFYIKHFLYPSDTLNSIIHFNYSISNNQSIPFCFNLYEVNHFNENEYMMHTTGHYFKLRPGIYYYEFCLLGYGFPELSDTFDLKSNRIYYMDLTENQKKEDYSFRMKIDRISNYIDFDITNKDRIRRRDSIIKFRLEESKKY